MQVFEIYFNPRAKEDIIFETFYYEPEDIYEKRLGHLFMVGELTNVLPQNVRFLKNLARVIKTKFYGFKGYLPEKSLKESLKEGNSFLEKIVKEGDVSWISNLNFAILNLGPKFPVKKTKIKKYKLNFTKIGDIEIFLSRDGKTLDIGKNLKEQLIEPYPLRVFSDIVSGTLESGDRIFVLTSKIYEFFEDEKLIEKIANLLLISEKSLNGILKDAKKEISGTLLLIDLKEKKEPSKKLIFKEKVLEKKFKKISEKIENIFIPFSLLRVQFQKILEIFSKKLTKVLVFLKNKKLILVLIFLFLIFLGSLFAKIEENREIAKTQIKLKTIQEKLNEAESLLILNQQDRANSLLLEAFKELPKIEGPLKNQIALLKKNIEAKLFDLNKLEVIEEPELIFEFSPQEMPQKIIFSKEKIYFFSPYSENIFELDQKGKMRIFEIREKFNQATLINDKILFFSISNQFFPFKDGEFGKTFSLKPPFEGFEFENLCSFKSNLYFLDKKTGEIIKYRHFKNLEWGDPKFWLDEQAKKAIEASSMTIDGGIWILKENLIDKYYGGKLQKTIKIEIFPFPKNLTKIWTSPTLPYLYILEPDQKRIIILDKEGQITKQYQGEKFDNLKDFSISENGKTIYLLNAQKLYRITVSL